MFSTCVQVGDFCNSWSLTLLSHGLDIHNCSDYEEKGVDFIICKDLKMTL